MRSVIALTIAGVAMAQDEAAPVAAPVMRAPMVAAPMMGASAVQVARAGMPMGFNGVASPYMVNRGVARNISPYGGNVVRMGAYNPYNIVGRQATMAAAPAPVAPAPVVPAAPKKPFDQASHQNDYENWRMAYLHSKAEQSDALANSPLWNMWNMVDSANSPLGQETKDKLLNNFQMQTLTQKMEAASYAISVSAARGASDAVLDDLKKEYEFERLKAMNLQLNNPMIEYQINRYHYGWDAGYAEYVASLATTPAEKRDAKLVMQMAQMDFLDSFNNALPGGGMAFGANLNNIVRVQARAAILRGVQRQFDEQKAAYKADPSAENFYKLQMDELQLEKHETKYMRHLSTLVKPLENLMDGNYFQSLRFREEQIEAKVADLAEKLAREQYKINQDREPYGATDNTPSIEKQQRMFYNLGR